MKSPKQARRDAKELFRDCFANGALDAERVRRVVAQVIQAKPRGYLAILLHFQRLLKLEMDRRAARIESAASLAPGEAAEIQNRLTRLYGPGLDYAFAQNPGLIGGLRIQVGSDVYDGSIRARLAALEQSF
jgi:F-type H+-transporting ATPase subunit delta